MAAGGMQVCLGLSDGSTRVVEVRPTATVADLLQAAREACGRPLALSYGGRPLDSTREELADLGICSEARVDVLDQVIHHYAGDRDGVYPVMITAGEAHPRGDPYARYGTVPKPEGVDGLINIASETFGATVRATSNLWGDGADAQERLKNVLRGGFEVGEPYYLCNRSGGAVDQSFIFQCEAQTNMPQMVVNFGTVCEVHRIAVLQWDDRWLFFLNIETSVGEMGFKGPGGIQRDKPEGYCEYHSAHQLPRERVWLHFDKSPPVRAQYVRFTTRGMQYDGGARLSRVWVWGKPVSPG
eukprot:TRINITY_DN17804_c0_g1_i1.p1 TRINITY_DN17804_c0_g1~~TRINITY_DN17804_c0_g1_i1.p1  ORF type:complete len:335 (+),score=78.43 TRINITY_DN17804_c0_g1_i1:114-1007(+)